MKKQINLLVGAAAYALTVLIGVVMFCRFSLYRCELLGGGELILTEWIIPVVIVATGLFLAGVGVAYINFLLAAHKQGLLRWPVLRFALGSAAGLVPVLFWIVLTNNITNAYRPSLLEVPFLIGGVMVALVSQRKSIHRLAK